MTPLHRVEFEPADAWSDSAPAGSLLQAARQAGVAITSVCGSRGTCRACRVRVVGGAVTASTEAEADAFSPADLEAGWRLACQAYPRGDCRVSVPADSMTASQRAQTEGLDVDVPLDPAVAWYDLALAMPSLADLRADDDRLLEALTQHDPQVRRIDAGVSRTLSPRLREWGWECRVVTRGDEVIAATPRGGRCIGLAVDLGTTKIAGYLVDLVTGHTVASAGTANPQASYGADIVSRMTSALESDAGAESLRSVVVAGLNRLAGELCATADASPDEIVDAVVAGNTAMHHLLLGLPVRQLARSPFVPAVAGALDVKARLMGLDLAPGACVHMLPNIAGFIGGDHVAMLLATGADPAGGPILALDIGTNTEISLLDGDRVTTVSCASGPAFEGGHVTHGMQAAAGAIERLRIDGDEVQYQTVGEAPATGICGSGMLDALAQLRSAGVLDAGGRMDGAAAGVRGDGPGREYVLVPERQGGGRAAITITQKDVRELQLAKAAIRAGVRVLLEATGLGPGDLARVVIAGAFGSYIDVESAFAIGMLPRLPRERFTQVGNAAGTGARLALVSGGQREEARALAERARYIELASTRGFAGMFSQACEIAEYGMVGAA